jgi:hypothetical protein
VYLGLVNINYKASSEDDTISTVMVALKQLLSADFKINCSGNTSGSQSLLDTRMPDKRPHT